MKIGINFCCVLAVLSADALSLNANVTVPDSVAEPGVEQMATLVVESNGEPEINSLFQLGSNVPTHLNVAAPAKKRPWLAGAEVVIIGKTKRIFLQKRSGSKLAKTNRTCFNVIKTKIRTENSEDLTIKQQGANTRF